jgi:hypothetical protein
MKNLVNQNVKVALIDVSGKIVTEATILQGSSIGYIDTSILYQGVYFLKVYNQEGLSYSSKLVITK